MTVREVSYTESCKRTLRRLARQHPDLPDTVAAALKRYAVGGPSARYRQQGVDGRPVFKERLPLRGMSKRRGARLIVYCDDERVVALFVYTKSALGVIPGGVIRDALDEAGLTNPAPEGEAGTTG